MVKKIFAYSYVYLILFLMYVPILTLIVFSFTNATYIGTWNGFDLSLYKKLFESEEIMIALGNTFIIAIISAVCSTVLGTLGAVGVFYSKKTSRAIFENINQIPVVNAEIVMALSLVVMFVFIGNKSNSLCWHTSVIIFNKALLNLFISNSNEITSKNDKTYSDFNSIAKLHYTMEKHYSLEELDDEMEI